jgi:hypothetical protein
MAKETVPARIYWGLAKVFDRKRHKQHKRDLLLRALAEFGTREDAFSFGRPEGPTFKHSGNAGDLIYALPMIKHLAGSQGASLRLALNVPISNKHLRHPLGNVMLNQGIFDLLAGLLAPQDYLQEVRVHAGEAVDFDLDVIRRAPLPHDRLGISHWYSYFLGVAPDLSQPWLKVEPDPATRNTVLLARSERYRNDHLDFGFLGALPDLAFVGLAEEYEDMRRQLPNLRWMQVEDFHMLARLIAGCRLFIGNQSFPYALAEGLKVPRVLELFPLSPNVIPMGGQAHGILFQRQFEHVVAGLLA